MNKSQIITNSELLINRILGLLISLLSVPFIISNCGIENYGIFIVISSISIFLSVSDFGIGNGIVNSLAGAFAQNNKNQVNVLLTSVLAFSIFNAGLIIIVYYLFFDRFDFNNILNLSLGTVTVNQFTKIAFLGAALTLIGNVSRKLLMASLQHTELSRFNLFIIFGTNIGLVLTSRNSNPLAGMLLVSLVLPSIVGIFHLILKIEFDSSIRISYHHISYLKIWHLIRESSLFFFIQSAAVINFQIYSILINHFLNPSEVAEYAVVLKIGSVPFILVSAVVVKIWGETASFLALSKFDSAYRNLIQNVKRVTLFTSLAMVIFIIFGQSLIRIWTGNQISPSKELILANAIWIPISCFMQLLGMFANGARETKFLMLTTSLFTISNLSLAFYFLKFEGNISGPMWSNSISALIFYMVPGFLMIKRYKSKSKDTDVV